MKRWIDLLPPAYAKNPTVIVVMAPIDSISKVVSTPDKYELGVLDCDDKRYGLQVVYPQMATRVSHEDVFRLHDIKMAKQEYVGPLADIPQRLLLEDKTVPLVFIRDAMWRPYLHLRRYIAGITPTEEANAN